MKATDDTPPDARGTAAHRRAPERMDPRLRWFIGLHLGSVAMAISVAASVGGGLDGDPFPPDLARPASPSTPQAIPAPMPQQAEARTTSPGPAAGLDTPRPWSVDRQGGVRWQPD